MKYPSLSLIIRTLNEKEQLESWLSFLEHNLYPGKIEIIIVDNESTDGTQKLAIDNHLKLIPIKREEFSYPKQLNLGMAAAKNEIVIITVAHAYPAQNNWLITAGKYFKDPLVAGVYGPCLPGKNAKLTEKIFYGSFVPRDHFRPVRKVVKAQMGVLGATNMAIRRSLWQRHSFDEAFGAGGEDTQWAKWALESGYHIVFDRSFGVHHSHGLTLREFLAQYRDWISITKPRPYARKPFQRHLNYD